MERRNDTRPLRVAVVGAGPAGFYTAEHLLRQEDHPAEVDVFDRLPTPHGLVRGGVAPDHPKIKSVTRVYDKTAARPGFRFYGNVELGRHITAAELASAYDAVVWTYGAETDRRLGIPGEELPGSIAATAFVGWYNAHPDHVDLDPDLSHERAVVIGNGNVAADLARMLVLPREELDVTDAADHAIEALARSGIREVYVVGRRGPAQAAFTNPEVRELGELTEADVIVDPEEVELDERSRAYIDSEEADPTHRRNVELFEGFSQREPEGKPRRVVLLFKRSPVEITGEERVEGITLERNELVERDGRISARGTGETEHLECGLVLRSVGYSGRSIEGLPFDAERCVIPNEAGRVIEPGSAGQPVTGHYTSGWIKRGPSGVIGTNKKDAQETVETLLADVEAGLVGEPATEALDAEAAAELIAERAPEAVTFAGWQAIDEAEREAGEPRGRPRVKISSVAEMLEAARARVG